MPVSHWTGSFFEDWPTEAIEGQLAHAERNNVTGAYNLAESMGSRRKMMQEAWADYLDGLRKCADVVRLRRSSL
jgi:hypothetical protein